MSKQLCANEEEQEKQICAKEEEKDKKMCTKEEAQNNWLRTKESRRTFSYVGASLLWICHRGDQKTECGLVRRRNDTDCHEESSI